LVTVIIFGRKAKAKLKGREARGGGGEYMAKNIKL
jgi:hypothetical protein